MGRTVLAQVLVAVAVVHEEDVAGVKCLAVQQLALWTQSPSELERWFGS